jgi:hypothetical protein
MAQRVYERQQVIWELDVLEQMASEGRAQKVEPHGIWIVDKAGGGKVAVRPEQILLGADEPFPGAWEAESKAEAYAESAWLRAAEAKADEDYAFEDYERSCGKIDQAEAAAIARAQDLAAERARHADLLAEFGVT